MPEPAMSPSNQPERKSLWKSIGTVGLITAVSRILGLVREMVRASLLGTSYYSDAFTLAFSLPNLFRRLTAEGVMTNAFIPIFCEVQRKEGRSRALAFSRHFFWLSTILLTALSATFVLTAPWLVRYLFAPGFAGETLRLTVFLTRFMFAYIILISLAAVCQGVLNSFSVFWVSAATPVLLNIGIVGCALLFSPHLENPTIGFAVGVLIGGAAQLLFQLPFLHVRGFRLLGSLRFDDIYLKRVATLLLPTLFGVGIYQINIIVGTLIATTLQEGSLSSLNFSNRLLELVLGVFIVSIATVILPKLSHLFIESRPDEIRIELQNAVRVSFFVTLPVTAMTLVAAEEIVTILFMRGRFDTDSMVKTAGALRFHILGLAFIASNRILLTGYQAAKRLKRTVQVSAIVMVVNLLLAFGASRSIGHLGIALANTVSQIAQAVLLVCFIGEISVKRFVSKDLGKPILKSLLTFLAMLVILFPLKRQLMLHQLSALSRLSLLLPLGAACFGITAYLLKSKELDALIRLFTKRTGKDREI